MNWIEKPLLLFIVLIFLLFHEYSFCEQTMDSADALSSAEYTASDRLKTGHYQEALQAERSALKIAQDRLGPTHPSLVPILENLATLDRYLALYPEAESHLQWALAIHEKSFGMEDPQLAPTLTQLASLYFDWGHWADAEFFQKKAVAILRDSGKKQETSPEFQPALELLGKIELQLQKKDEALSILKENLGMVEKDSFSPPARLVRAWDLLAQAYQASSKASDEQACLEKALQAARGEFKPNAIEVADAMKKLADFDRSNNRVQDAESLYESALKINQGYVGSYFGYSSLSNVQKLAKLDESVGQWKEAEDLLQKALQASKETFGPNHPRVAVALLDLAEAQEGLGQKDAAHENLKQALEMAKSFYPDDYPLVTRIQKELQP
jgi:tetratricopeptide (TPR) repeat protein